MKKSLLAALVAGIFLLTVGAFAGTITVSDIPDIFVADDGNPSGTVDDQFVFSQSFMFADYVSVAGGSSTNAITVSYIVFDSSPTIDSKLALSIEGAAHPLTTTGNWTAPTAIGTVAGLDSGAEGIEAGILYIDYINTPPVTGSPEEYTRHIKFIGDNGDDTPGTSDPEVNIFIDDGGVDRFSGAIVPLFIDTFDAGAEGWFFTSILGSSTQSTPTGALAITYNNTGVFSYWKRPLTGANPDIGPLSADTLYRAVMSVSSSVASSSTMGDIPDFRVATGLANGASELYFVSSFLSNGSSNFISPLLTPRDYYVYFEATGLPAGAETSALIMQFEGFNWPFSGRPYLIGAAVGLNRAEVDAYPAYLVNEAGTVVHSIADAAGFNLGSGTANGWNYTTFTTSGQNAGAVGAKHADNEGLVITGNPMGSYTWIYGSWDANPGLAASFSSGVLYRATFKITTVTVASAIVNQPIPQVRIQTGDNHVAVAGNLFSNNGSTNNKQLTNDEASTPPIDLWFYYDGATRTAGSFNENKIYPSFEFLVLPGVNIPDGAALTLRSYELSEQITP